MVANIEVISTPTGEFVGFRLSYGDSNFVSNSCCPPKDWFEVQLYCVSNLPDNALIVIDDSVYDFMLSNPYKFAFVQNKNGKAYISHNAKDRDDALEIIVNQDFASSDFEYFKIRYL